MTMNKALQVNRKKILGLWFEATIRTYPEDTARFLVKAKDRFQNPIGSATMDSLEAVMDILPGTIDQDKVEEALDPVIRIRAIQTFTAARAVGFVFALKDIIKNVLGSNLDDTIDRKVDQIGLAAFNRFMKCREQIFLLKATEAKRRIHGAFERAGLVKELKEEDLLGSQKS